MLRKGFATLSSPLYGASPLAKLRKETGYSLSICKKALEQNDQDLNKSFEWLKEQAQAEGWAKANKLQGRNTTQGLVGLLVRDRRTASIVELNCETDFVARNSDFRGLLNEVAVTISKQTGALKSDDDLSLKRFNADELKVLLSDSSGKTLSDLLALNIGKLGENLALKRGALFEVPEGTRLAALTHPTTETNGLLFGRFGVLLAYTKEGGEFQEGESEEIITKQLCQHIIGLNPSKIGSLDEEEAQDSDSQLVHQTFLADEERTVGEVLRETGITVKHFERIEVGRNLED